MALKFRRGTTAQQSGSLAFGEPFVNTTLGTLLVGGPNGDIVLSAGGTGSTGNFGAISGSGLDITGNAKIAGNLTLGGAITIGDASADTINVIASVSSSIIPSVTNAFDLGSENYFWRDIYVSTGSIKFVGAAGNVVGTLTNIGNGLNLDAGIVTKGDSSFGTSSLAVTSVTGSLRVSGSLNVIGGINGVINATNGVVSGSSQITYANISSIPAGIISGSSQLSGTSITDLTIVNLTTVNQTASVVFSSGSNRFGDAGNDTHEFTGSVQVSGSHTVIGASTATSFNGAINATNGVVSGSSQLPTLATTGSNLFRGDQIVSGSFQLASTSSTLLIEGNIFSQTYLTTNGALVLNPGFGGVEMVGSYRTFQATDITAQGTLSASVITGIGNVTAFSTSVDSKLSNLNSTTASLNTSVTNINSTTASLNTSITNLNSTTASLLIETANLESFSSSALTRLSALEVETANLESFTSSINTTIKTRLDANTVVSGSSQITLSSTTGYGTVINQNLLTTSNVQFNSLGIGMAANGTAGRIDATNDVVAFSSSDIRFKENIKPIENAIDKIRKISGNTYDWKEENKVEHGYEGNDVGVIAQEIEAVLPQLVQTRESGFKAVKYDKLVALLIEGIKEQQLQIEQLRIDLNNCRNNKGL